MWPLLAFSTIAVATLSQGPEVGMVLGEVRSETNGEPVPYAVVEVLGARFPLTAEADSLGRYELRDVPAGRYLLRARGAAHRTLAVEALIPAGRQVRIDFNLRMEPLLLPGLLVKAMEAARRREVEGRSDAELGRVAIRTLEATPGLAELGLVELGRAVRSPQEPVDPTDVLYVRGAPADLKLVLLDGAPVYTPFHAGGLLQAFEPGLIQRADFYLGGAPARYDGGLSYVLDLETREGAQGPRLQSTGSVDLLSTRLMLNGPLPGGVGLTLGTRAVHGLGTSWFLNESFPYRYGDALGRLDLALGSSGNLGLTGFWNRESIDLDDRPALAERKAVWGNRAASLHYRGRLFGREAEVTLAHGSYRAVLPLSDGWHTVADGTARQTRFGAVFSGGDEILQVDYGVTYEHIVLAQSARAIRRVISPPDEVGLGEVVGANTGTGTNSNGTTAFNASSSGTVRGVYADLNWNPAPPFSVRGGLRADHFSTEPGIRLAPRLALTWATADRVALTVAGGRYRQFVRGSTAVMTDSAGYPAGVPEAGSLSLASASHLLISIDQRLLEEVLLGIEGYFKRYDGVPTPEGLGRANASGVDLWMRRDGGRISGWVGYSLGWVWAAPPEGTATETFSGRHLLSLGVVGEVGAGGQLGLKVGYGAGLPYSALPNAPHPDQGGLGVGFDHEARLEGVFDLAPDAPPIASAPDRPYLRLDAELSYPWETDWGGSRVVIVPYIKVYNALDRRDAFFYRVDSGHGEPRPLAALPFLPILGMQWRF